jgi:uncharacterized protein (TIGR02145 family)
MRTQLTNVRANSIRPLLTATLALAITLTLSCSGGDPDNGNISGNGGGGNSIPSYGIGNYKTAAIGSQTWMAENLNFAASGSVCYNNQESNCDIYGRLYDWATAMALPPSCNSTLCASLITAKHRGICPTGWHIPSDAEWTMLTDFVGGWFTAGTKLKAKSGWNDYEGQSGNGTDEHDFSALPGGFGKSNSDFVAVGSTGVWWSSAECDASNADYSRGMEGDAYVVRDDFVKTYLSSVRCIQN